MLHPRRTRIGIKTNFDKRSNEPELMDGTDYRVEELVENLAFLRSVNRLLGGQSALNKHLFPMIDSLNKNEVKILDVGTGSADIPIAILEWARSNGISTEFVVVDINETAIKEAKLLSSDYPEIRILRADASRLPFADKSFDFVLASLFLHHFDSRQAAALIKSFSRIAGVAIIINDLRRHPIAYYSILSLTKLLTQNRLVRYDAALSVLRGFSESDIDEISTAAGLELEIYRHFPYRYIMVGKMDNNHHI